MCPESWAPSLQRGVGCKLLAERAPSCRLCCHWSPHRDLQQGEEPRHQSSSSQTIHNQQAAQRGFLQVPEIFEDPERLIPESQFGEPVCFWALSVQHLWLCLHQPQCGAVAWSNRGQPVELLQRCWCPHHAHFASFTLDHPRSPVVTYGECAGGAAPPWLHWQGIQHSAMPAEAWRWRWLLQTWIFIQTKTLNICDLWNC